jgi:ribonuclease T
MTQIAPITFATRFRGFLPVVVDVETGGFNSQTDALLEIAAVFLELRSDGTLARGETFRYHVTPFPGSNMEPASMAVNGIDPHHPLRPAISEEDALQRIFKEVRNAVRRLHPRRTGRSQCVFDLNFLNAASCGRDQATVSPLHQLRHGTWAASRLSNRADARHSGCRFGVGTPLRPFCRLRCRAHGRLFCIVAPVSKRSRCQPWQG